MLAQTLKVYGDRGLIPAILFHLFHDRKAVTVNHHVLTTNDLWALELIGNRIIAVTNNPQQLTILDPLEVGEFMQVLDTVIKFLKTKKGRELKQYTFSLEFDGSIRNASRYLLEVKRSGPDGYLVSGAQIRGLK